MTEVTVVGTVAAILAGAGLLWAAVATKRARDDRARLQAAMEQLVGEVNAADLAEVQGFVGEPGHRVKAETLSSPEDIVARVVGLARPPAQRGPGNLPTGRGRATRTEPEDHNQQGPAAPASP
jgi:hypothetical protein